MKIFKFFLIFPLLPTLNQQWSTSCYALQINVLSIIGDVWIVLCFMDCDFYDYYGLYNKCFLESLVDCYLKY